MVNPSSSAIAGKVGIVAYIADGSICPPLGFSGEEIKGLEEELDGEITCFCLEGDWLRDHEDPHNQRPPRKKRRRPPIHGGVKPEPASTADQGASSSTAAPNPPAPQTTAATGEGTGYQTEESD